MITDLGSRGLSSAATYLRKLKEQGIVPEIVMVATVSVEREFREIKGRTEIGARWTDEGAERVARLLEEVRLNGTRLEF